MENGSRECETSVLNLPDDCLYFIFQRLNSGSDRESFGLTCHRWLNIQNSSRRSLEFQCSFSQLNRSSLSRDSNNVTSSLLYGLLNRFRQLESLSLSGCTELPDSSLTQLLNHGSKLHTLYLDCCFGITDTGLSVVAFGCPNLTILSLYRCNVSDIGLETLAECCLLLKDVNLSWCTLISDHGIRTLSQKCSQLRVVKISNCNSISGVGFQGCSQNLTYLEADSCKLEPKGISCIVSGGGLEYLNVSCLCWGIRGDGLSAIGCGFATRLKVLNFRSCRTAGNEAIMAIAKGCPLLQEWNLSVCPEIRISGWESIGLYCHNLERLHVNRCQKLCDQGLKALRNGCKSLRVLYITHCRQVTYLAIEMFRFSRSGVDIKQEEIMCIAPDWGFR